MLTMSLLAVLTRTQLGVRDPYKNYKARCQLQHSQTRCLFGKSRSHPKSYERQSFRHSVHGTFNIGGHDCHETQIKLVC